MAAKMVGPTEACSDLHSDWNVIRIHPVGDHQVDEGRRKEPQKRFNEQNPTANIVQLE